MRRSGTINIDGAIVEAHHLWYVREELRLYPRRKQRLAYLQTCIVTETAINETPGIQGSHSDPTLGRAMALARDQEVRWLEPRMEWIERVWQNLDPVTNTVLNLMIIKGTHTAAGTAMEVQAKHRLANYSAASVFREMNRGLLAFAIDMWGKEIIINGKPPRWYRKISETSAEVESLRGTK